MILQFPGYHPRKGGGAPRSLEDMEKDYILKVLRETGGNQSKASHLLGIDRKTLYLKLKKYDIDESVRK